MEYKVYVSGMNSGQNPCAGLGIVRSIRMAFPELKIVGVENWHGASGLHDPAVSEALWLPPWSQINEEMLITDFTALLNDGGLWVPGLDMDVHWISQKMPAHRNLLTPSLRALELTEKPAVKILEGTDFRVPEYISAALPDSEIHAFLRHSSWQCWLKSPCQDAKRVTSWGDFERGRENLKKNWKTARLFIQRHVVGTEETIAFAAYGGKLLGAAYLEKKIITPEGKTWAGRVTPVTPEDYAQLEECVRGLEWSGGGEVEFVRDPDGEKWIIEWNPRFPAWIYGAALAGINLPAQLVTHATNGALTFQESPSPFPYFTRVVHEIAAKESIGLPFPKDPSGNAWTIGGGKKGGGPMFESMPPLRDTVDEDDDENEVLQDPESIPEILFEDVKRGVAAFAGDTPHRIQLDGWSRSRFESVADKISQFRGQHPEVRIGYSVKTSPTDNHLRTAKENGFLAECISQMEVRRALGAGYRPEDVILNGPGKFWPLTASPITGLHSLFCDSFEEFDRVMAIPGIAKCIGFRFRLPSLGSRFGHSLGEFENFQRVVGAVKQIKGRAELGFHFRMPSWAIGVTRWMEGFKTLLLFCQSVEQLSQVPVRYLDLGGGFYPSDVERLRIPDIQEAVQGALPKVEAVYFELGRSLTQESEALISRVLDVRHDHEGELIEIVVDASIAELPLARTYPHRIFFKPRNGGERDCRPLDKGSKRILGRICMEDDILSSQVELPEDIQIGDYVIFGDSGAYERSMSYVFGRG